MALVAYNAYFADGSNFSKREYLEKIVYDAMAERTVLWKCWNIACYHQGIRSTEQTFDFALYFFIFEWYTRQVIILRRW